MWKKSASKETTASKENIWNIWTDVGNWKNFDNDVLDSSLSGNFTEGVSGRLTPRGGPKTKFELVEVTPYKSFTTRSHPPLTTIDIVHYLEEKRGKIQITHEVKIYGFLSILFSRIIGNDIAKGLPETLEKLCKKAENV